MKVHDDAWLASIMGRPVFRVDAAGDDAAAVREHREHVGARTAFYYAKVDTRRIAAVKTLLELGFFVADVNTTFAVRPTDVALRPNPEIEVGAVTPATAEDVLSVAHDSFRFTRFHLDPLVGTATANAVKREWIRSYVERKRGDHLFVASTGGRPVGFLAALVTGEPRSAVIDLVGVRESAQRSGVGRTMIARFAEHYRDAKELVVGTQVANVPSISLYESMGFRFKSSQYVLHMHTKDGAAI